MEFIDTKNSFMSIKEKIVLGNWFVLTGTDAVGSVNLSAHGLFEQVEVKGNENTLLRLPVITRTKLCSKRSGLLFIMKYLLKRESLFVHYLLKLKERAVKAILKYATKSQVDAISRIIFNGINKSFHLKPPEVKAPKPYKTSLYLIADKNTILDRKRKLLARRHKQALLILNAAKMWI